MEWTVSEQLAAQAIGQAAMAFIDRETITASVNAAALELLEEIREILNNETLDDPECFHRIDAIVSAFLRRGIGVDRHDFG